MKGLFLFLLITTGAVLAQVNNPSVIYVVPAPSGSCAQAPPIQVVNSTGTVYTCDNGTWAAQGGGGGNGFPIVIGSTSIASGSTTTSISGLTLVAPALGTPTALVLTNATALPAAQVLSGSLANGMAATTQSQADGSTKLATTAYVDTGLATKGVGTVTSVATTSPITGGTITGTGTIGCAGCVTSSSPGAGVAHFAGSTQAVTSSAVALTDMATQAADTVVQNATGGTASPTAVAMPTCTSGADLYNTTTHAWSCVTAGAAPNKTYFTFNSTPVTLEDGGNYFPSNETVSLAAGAYFSVNAAITRATTGTSLGMAVGQGTTSCFYKLESQSDGNQITSRTTSGGSSANLTTSGAGKLTYQGVVGLTLNIQAAISAATNFVYPSYQQIYSGNTSDANSNCVVTGGTAHVYIQAAAVTDIVGASISNTTAY